MDLPAQLSSYSSLREWMVADDALNRSTHPLVRLGALYHLDEKYPDDIVIEKVRKLLGEDGAEFKLGGKINDLLFCLHTAVYLANMNEFEGVKWILQAFVDLPEEKKSYAQIALGSCYRFPFAILLKNILDVTISAIDIPLLEKLLKHSEDEFIEFSQKTLVEQRAHLESILDELHAVNKIYGRSGQELAAGSILQRPFRENIGFTHTGFVSLDFINGNSWVLPYEADLVINKNNPLLRQSTWVMQSSGRRVLAVYETQHPNNVKFVYLLPFAALSKTEFESYLTNLLVNAQGADLAVIHSKWSTDKGEFCRWITRSGQTRVISNQSRKYKLGNISIIHPENPRPLRTDSSIGMSAFPFIEKSFASTINLDFAVVADVFRGKDRHLVARIIRSDGATLLRPVDEDVKPGTPVFYLARSDEGGRERIDTVFFTRVRIEGACESCSGVGFTICPTCDGEIFLRCPSCNGTGEIMCTACSGTQKCDLCKGTGEYEDTGRDCLKCEGTGKCKYCKRRKGYIRCKAPGCEFGKIKCPNCLGNRVVDCTCGGEDRGYFVIA